MSRTLLTCLLASLAAALCACQAPAAPQAGPRYVGVQENAYWSSDTAAQNSRDLDRMAALGVNAVRLDVGWSSLQADGPDGYASWYVDRLDAFVAGAAARHIKVIATLDQSPCWGALAPASVKQGCTGSWWQTPVVQYSPADPAAYARVARFLTHRYGTRLAALEIWNEPNQPFNFRGRGDRATRYAALVRATYPEAKAGNRSVPVLAGAMASADTGFLARLYAAGIAGAYDGISLHPYADGRAPDDTTGPARFSFVAGLSAVHAAQVAAGQVRPLWATEFGYPACDHAPCQTPAEQADLIGRSVLALGALPFVRGASLYELRDAVDDPSSEDENFGLLRHDFAPRPAFAAFRRSLARLRAGTPPSPGGG